MWIDCFRGVCRTVFREGMEEKRDELTTFLGPNAEAPWKSGTALNSKVPIH
jgi:hypothetical protein